jgi:penicillin-binding protein 2
MDPFVLSFQGRRKIGIGLVLLVCAVATVGLFRLQVIEHSDLAAQSENNRIRVVPIIPRRGRVYDRDERIIIDNRPSYTVSVVPTEEVREVTVPRLAELLGMDTLNVRKRIKRNMVNRYQPSAVKRDVDFETIAILEEQSADFPGVTYQMERVRQYERSLGAESFTGYVGEVSEDELKKLRSIDYRLGSMIGKKGLEKQYDQFLRGWEGTEYIEVTASGQRMGKYPDRPPEPAVAGTDVFLTIDQDIQRACSEALDTFCCGSIVAMDPRNGEVLAMISYPGYDANIFSSVIPESLWQEISNDTTHPLLNRPLNGLYPPGSTTKLVTLGAGLEEGTVTYNTTFSPCVGGYQFGNRFFRCWNAGGHGSLNGVHAIEQSCDVYFYQLGLKLGIDELSRYFGLCGFGRPTGIDLPMESAGLNPNTEYYNRRYGERGWTRGLVLNNSIGQGEILVSILQLAQFFCGLANDGTVYRPHLIRKTIGPDDRTRFTEPTVSFRLPFSESTLGILMEALRAVVEGEHGTAKHLKNDLYSLGGKTGTAENPHGENHSWFVGVAPLESPEIVVVAIVENAGHGSEIAAPLVKSILDTYFEKKRGPVEVTAAETDRP